jgi:hypothetical protein
VAKQLLPTGNTIETKRIFIPSKVSDNKILMDNDPMYINNIAMAAAGQPWLLKAWLNGDWNIVAGGLFDDLYNEAVHVIEPFDIPSDWELYRAYDWGSAKPFSIGWYAKSNGNQVKLRNGTYRTFTNNTLIRIDEWYGWNGNADQGINMLEVEIAEGIAEREQLRGWDVESGPADPMIFNDTQGGSLADAHYERNIVWIPADKGLRVTGWQQCRQLLSEALKPNPEGPCFYVFNTCIQFIRTVPTLPRSKSNIDDADSKSEDHIADEWRYMVRHVPQLCIEEQLTGT